MSTFSVASELEKDLDKLVYYSYGLVDSNIKIIEEALNNHN